MPSLDTVTLPLPPKVCLCKSSLQILIISIKSSRRKISHSHISMLSKDYKFTQFLPQFDVAKTVSSFV